MKIPPRLHRRKRPAPQANGGNRSLTLATASLIGLLALVVTVQIFRSALPRIMGLFDRGNRIDLAYLPPDAEFLAVIRPARVWTSPLCEAYRAHPEYVPRLSPLWRIAGLRPADVDTLTFAATNAFARSVSATGGPDLRQFVAVFRSHHAIAEPESLDHVMRVEPMAIEGSRYWRITPESVDSSEVLAAWLPDKRTLVLGREDLVRRTIEAAESVERRTDLDFIDPHHDVLVVLAPADPLGLRRVDLGPVGAIPSLDALIAAHSDRVTAASLGLKLAPERELELLCRCVDAEAAAALETGARTALAGLLSGTSADGSDSWRRLHRLGRQTIDSAHAGRSGNVVQVSGNLPETIESVMRDRSLGRAHALLYQPWDRAFAEFPSSDFLADFQTAQENAAGSPDEHMEPEPTRF